MLIQQAGTLLEAHKERLGPLYQPLSYLLGALVFLVIAVIIVGAPVVYLGSHLLAVVGQIFLLAIYLFLLQAVRYSVVDRFAFYLCFLTVFVSAAATLDIDSQFQELLQSTPALREADIPRINVPVYGLLRGCGYFAWLIPLVLGYLTFATDSDSQRSKKLLRNCLWMSLGLQSLAIVTILVYEGVLSRLGAPIPETAPSWLSQDITMYQRLYTVTYAGTLFAGLIAPLLIILLKLSRETQILATTTATCIVVSLLFLLSQTYSRELNLRYPAARQNESIRIRVDGDSATYIHPFLSRLGGNVVDYLSVFACERAEGLFSYRAKREGEIGGTEYSIHRLLEEKPHLLICWNESG